MKQHILVFLLSYVLALGTAIPAVTTAQESVELRFWCFEDDNECRVYADLLARFSKQNPDISVAVEAEPREGIEDRLLAKIEAGEAPDFARIADFDTLAGHYLDLRQLLMEPNDLDASFRAPYFEALRSGPDDDGMYGYPDALGVVAPFVNLSAFDQAGVALPDAEASWDEWLGALEQVVQMTGVPYALAVDNKDHRLAGPAMSLGMNYLDDEGNLSLSEDIGLRSFLQLLDKLLAKGEVPIDTLLGTGNAQDYFVRGEALMYVCGSWKAAIVADEVGDAFDWAIVPNPSGPNGSTGVVQATALVALSATEHPDAVARVLDYLLKSEIITEFSARTLRIPAHENVATTTIAYQTDNEVVAAALNGFVREVPKLQDQAIALDLHTLASVYYEASNTYLRAYFSGDLTMDEALVAIEAQLAAAAKRTE